MVVSFRDFWRSDYQIDVQNLSTYGVRTVFKNCPNFSWSRSVDFPYNAHNWLKIRTILGDFFCVNLCKSWFFNHESGNITSRCFSCNMVDNTQHRKMKKNEIPFKCKSAQLQILIGRTARVDWNSHFYQFCKPK